MEVLLAASLWGATGPLSVALFGLGVPPASVALLRPAVGGIALIVPLLVLRPESLRAPPAGILLMMGVGGLATAVFHFSYQLSTESAGVPATVALLYLAPAFVVATAGPLLGEWPTPRKAVLALVSVAGVWLTVLGARGAGLPALGWALVWGVLTGAGYAGYTLFGRHSSPRYGPLATLAYSTLGACLFLLLAVGVSEGGVVLPPTAAGWGVLALFGVCTVTVASLLFFDALARIEAGRAAIAATLEPLVAALLAAVFLGQHLDRIGWTGLLLLVAGVAGAYGMGDGSGRGPRPGPA